MDRLDWALVALAITGVSFILAGIDLLARLETAF